MKRIIDIPEEVYSNIAIDNCSLGEVRNLLGIVAESTPFDSVIEDIKAEIDENYKKACDAIYAQGLEMAEIIIDKHISRKEK